MSKFESRSRGSRLNYRGGFRRGGNNRGLKRFHHRNNEPPFSSSTSENTLYEITSQIIEHTDEGRVGFRYAFNKVPILERYQRSVFGLCAKILNNWEANEEAVEKSGILEVHPNFNKHLIRAIIGELLWGNKSVFGVGEEYDAVREKITLLTALAKDSSFVKDVSLKTFTARVNTLKYSVKTCKSHLQDLGFKLIDTPSTYDEFLNSIDELEANNYMVDFHFEDLFVFSSKAKVVLLNNFIAIHKLIILQSKSSLIPVHLLDVQRGNKVLDMCAAPGMKTAIIASQLQRKGKVYALDKNRERFRVMINNLKEIGATNNNIVEFCCCDALLYRCNPDIFDLILLDAPCSGSGIIQRPGETDNSPERLKKLQFVQVKLLTNALTKYPNAKRVVYSTCSVNAEENESVVDKVMGTLGDRLLYNLINSHELIEGFSPGLEDSKCGAFCLRITTQRDRCNSFFVAVFEKDPEKVIPSLPTPSIETETCLPKSDSEEDQSEDDDKNEGEEEDQSEDEDENEGEDETDINKVAKVKLINSSANPKKNKRKHSESEEQSDSEEEESEMGIIKVDQVKPPIISAILKKNKRKQSAVEDYSTPKKEDKVEMELKIANVKPTSVVKPSKNRRRALARAATKKAQCK